MVGLLLFFDGAATTIELVSSSVSLSSIALINEYLSSLSSACLLELSTGFGSISFELVVGFEAFKSACFDVLGRESNSDKNESKLLVELRLNEDEEVAFLAGFLTGGGGGGGGGGAGGFNLVAFFLSKSVKYESRPVDESSFRLDVDLFPFRFDGIDDFLFGLSVAAAAVDNDSFARLLPLSKSIQPLKLEFFF